MVPKSAVLVVVDVQNGFITMSSAPVVPAIVGLVDRWLQAGGEVVFTRYVNYDGSPFERLIHWTKLRTAPETDIVADLQPYLPRATAVVDKTIYSLFSADGSRLVADRRWSEIYVCGIATESCVLKTVVDAFERDLTPWLIEDASASHGGEGPHDAGVLVAKRFIGAGQIIRVADVIRAMARWSATEVGRNLYDHRPDSELST